MLAAGGPLVNARGEKRGAVVFLRDITDRKEADEKLKDALQESEALARENSELSELGDSLQSCQTVEEAYGMSESALPAFCATGRAHFAYSIRHAISSSPSRRGTVAQRQRLSFVLTIAGVCGVERNMEESVHPCLVLM